MRTAQTAIMRDMQAHQTANRSYMEEGSNFWNWRTARTSCSKVSPRGKNANYWISYSRTPPGRTAN